MPVGSDAAHHPSAGLAELSGGVQRRGLVQAHVVAGLYRQFIKRLHRSGQKRDKVFCIGF